MPNVEDLFGKGKSFGCPHCGKPVKFKLHAEEIVAVTLLFLGIVLSIQHFAVKLKTVPTWAVLATVIFAIVAVTTVLTYLLRNKRRYEE
jgi:uncharacterized protein (DUF983 family)